METEKVKCLIVGSGPAYYTAAIYAGRANLSPVLYAGLQPGGQLTTTTDVENFPGYPQGIGGPELMEDLRKQAERFGADLRYGVATAANLAEAPYKITIDDEKMIEAETLIIATVPLRSIWGWRMKRNMREWVSALVPLVMVSSTARKR